MNDTEIVKDTTVPFDSWFDDWLLKKYEKHNKNAIEHILSAMLYLKESPAIVGFLKHPTGYYQNKKIEACSRRADCLTEAKDYFDNCNKKIIMYDVMHIPSVWVKSTVNPISMKVEEVNEPFMSKEIWILRYIEV